MSTSELFRLDGRVALVTGASRGLGRRFALSLAEAGADIVAGARDVAALASVVSEVERLGRRALALPLDVTDAASVHGWVEQAHAVGPPSVLVNSAGVVDESPWNRQAEDEWDRVLDTNLKGAWLAAQAVARAMVAADRRGSIINVASILGLVAEPDVPAYCASKGGLISLTRALALDLAPHGIRVNALAPGYFETDLNRDFLATPAGRALVARSPQRRTGEWLELVGPLLLLASDASSFMTGSVVVVDGGLSVAA